MGDQVKWQKVLLHQQQWAPLVSGGLGSWNLRGLCAHSFEIKDMKRAEVITMLKTHEIVFIQEPHLTSGTFPDFDDWCYKQKIFYLARPTTDIEEGVIALS